MPYPVTAIIDGDELMSVISAASILAKVTRNHEMQALHLQYPEYGFDHIRVMVLKFTLRH